MRPARLQSGFAAFMGMRGGSLYGRWRVAFGLPLIAPNIKGGVSHFENVEEGIKVFTEKSDMGGAQSENTKFIREVAHGFPVQSFLRSGFSGRDIGGVAVRRSPSCV
jgi:hypothetical protein